MKHVPLIVLGLIFALSSAFAASSDEATTVVCSDGVSLNGEFMVPDQVKAAVLIIQGSGNVGSDGDVSSPLLGSGYHGEPAKLSDQLAGALASAGIASLRYDKRGFADPSQLANQTMPYIVSDAKSALETLRKRFPNVKIGVVGFSEGALVATIVTSDEPVDALFLMSLPSRAIDEELGYQFLEWPVELVEKKLDKNQDGLLTAQELNGIQFPLLGPGFTLAPASSVESNHDGEISIQTELIPAYQQLLAGVDKIVQTAPAYSGWYSSMKALAPFSDYAQKVHGPVFLYQSLDDAQVKWSDVLVDQSDFATQPTLHLFPNLGHCFSPMDGVYGEVKTSGPYDSSVVSAVIADVAKIL